MKSAAIFACSVVAVAAQDPTQAARAADIAHQIVHHASACFAQHTGDETSYQQCTNSFCSQQCGAAQDAEGCRSLCNRNANGLFQRFAQTPAEQARKTRVFLQQQAQDAEKEQAAAMNDLVAAQSKMLLLNERIQDRAQQEMKNGDTARGQEEMAKAQQLNNLQAQIKEHLTKVSEFRGMAEEKEPKPVRSEPTPSFLQQRSTRNRGSAPEDDLAKEMTHDLEMNFNKIAPFGKEDTAKELQDHAAKTQDTLVDAVENAEVAEIKRAVFRALTRLRAATIKEFDTIARLETQAIDAYNDAHHYRAENPLAHLHEDEAPVETDKLKSFH